MYSGSSFSGDHGTLTEEEGGMHLRVCACMGIHVSYHIQTKIDQHRCFLKLWGHRFVPWSGKIPHAAEQQSP